MFIESVMPSNHLILCGPLLFLSSVFPSIRLFSKLSVSSVTYPILSLAPYQRFLEIFSGFWNVVLEKTLESPLDCKEIQQVHPKGDQSWVLIGGIDAEAETPIIWPPDAKSWLIWQNPNVGKDWRQEEKGMTEDEMVGWHHRLDGHEFGWTLGVGDGQGGLACCSPWVTKSQTWLSDWTELNWTQWK